MAVEIYVSSEELKKTLEYVALIGGNMASGPFNCIPVILVPR
jgi:hypothetical protein